MQVQTRPSSLHLPAGSHEQKPVFRRARASRRHFSARARTGPRSGVGVGIDAASTTAKRFFNGESRGRSQTKLLEEAIGRLASADGISQV